MVFGHCGLEQLVEHRRNTAIKNSILSCIAVCFGIVGCVSYTNNFTNMVNAPWIVVESKYSSDIENPFTDNTVYTAIGIQSFAVYSKNSDGKEQIDEKGPWLIDSAYPILTWEQCLNSLRENTAKKQDQLNKGFPGYTQETVDNVKKYGGWDRCEVCNQSSVVVVSFAIVALISAGVALVYHLLRIGEDSSFVKDMTVFAGGSAFICGAIAFFFFQKCFKANQDFYASLEDPNPTAVDKGSTGVGLLLVMLAFIFNGIAFTTTLLVPAPAEEEEVESESGDSAIESDDDNDIEGAGKEGIQLTVTEH